MSENKFFKLRKQNKSKKEYIRVDFYHLKVRVKFSTGIYVESEHWDAPEQKIRKSHPFSTTYNYELKKIHDRILVALKKVEGDFSTKKFMDLYKEQDKISVYKAWENYLENAEKKKTLKAAYITSHENALDNFRDFHKDKPLLFTDISNDLINKWGQSLGNDTYTRRLSAFLGEVEGTLFLPTRNGFSWEKFTSDKRARNKKRKKKKKLRPAIPMDELEMFLTMEFTAPNFNQVRNYIYLMYIWGGVEPIDLFSIKVVDFKKQIKEDHYDGKLYYYRAKTGKLLFVSYRDIPRVKNLVDDYLNSRENCRYLLPFMEGIDNPTTDKEDQKRWHNRSGSINRTLKRIAIRQGWYPSPWKMKSIKHAFSQSAYAAGVNSLQMSLSLGHDDHKTSGTYLSQYELDQKQEGANIQTKLAVKKKEK
jgi:integrase/recombinase XerD